MLNQLSTDGNVGRYEPSMGWQVLRKRVDKELGSIIRFERRLGNDVITDRKSSIWEIHIYLDIMLSPCRV